MKQKLPNLLGGHAAPHRRSSVAVHIGSATVGTRRRMAELAANNVLAALDGRSLPCSVNPEVVPHP